MLNFKSFKSKTYLAFGTIIFLSVTLLVTVIRLFSVLEGLTDYDARVDALKINVHRVKENENKMFLFDTKSKVFMEKGESPYIPEMEAFMDTMISEMDYLLTHELTEDYALEESYTEIIEDFNNYTSLIHQGIEKIREKGYDGYGAAGRVNEQMQRLKIRSILSEYEVTVNELEKLLNSYQLAESRGLSEMIIGKLELLEVELDKEGSNGRGISGQIGSLKVEFQNFSNLTHEIGLNGDEGIRAQLIKYSEEILGKCERLEFAVKSNVDREKNFLYFGFSALAGIQVLFAIVFAFGMTSGLIKRLEMIKNNLSQLSSGVFPNRIIVKNEDELAEISSSINELTDRIEYAANFARDIGKGKLDTEYQESYAKDALANAIKEMQEKLIETAKVDRLRGWKTEGIAKFGQILQDNKDKLESLAFNVLSNLVKYVGGNQGAFYVVETPEDSSPYLRVAAAYAYEREKHLDLHIEPGEGLIGEAWKEGEVVVLSEIPEEYYQITSGLGEALPKNVVILPLSYNEQIYGMIEIATFKELNEVQLEFLKELAASIAGTLSSTKVNQQTALLLEGSRKMQEEMQEQEEIMRQNIEEMQATQDSFGEKEENYIAEIKRLKEMLGMK